MQTTDLGSNATQPLEHRLGLLGNQDFIDFALSQGKTPNEMLDLPDVLPRKLACRNPVILDRISEDGNRAEMMLPCGTQNALKCPACAEFSQRLRQRQILNGFDTANSETRVALFTNTAPSFGRVHNASLSIKTEYKFRHLHPAKKDAVFAAEMRKSGPCPCKQYHRYDHPLIGTPLNKETYQYAREIIWSENLPNLVKSMTRKVRYLARGFDIPDTEMGMFTVFERQKRGALHTHTLLVVRGNPKAFDRLAKEIKTGWDKKHVPTAKIPEYRLKWYRSAVVAERWEKYGYPNLPGALNIEKSIPRAPWKGGELIPATQFGSVWDWRELSGNRNLDGETDGQDGFKQAGAYLAKYLTKNQQAASTAAIQSLPFIQGKHFLALRVAAACLTLDRVMYEGTAAFLERNLKEVASNLVELSTLSDDDPDEDNPFVESRMVPYSPMPSRALRRDPDENNHWEIQQLENMADEARRDLLDTLDALENPMPNPLFSKLFTAAGDWFWNIGETNVREAARSYGAKNAARGLAIRINKVLDNAGFSGSLVSVSHWGTTMKDLKDEMRGYMAAADPNGEETELFTYVLNPHRMKELRELRYVHVERSKPRGVLEVFRDSKLLETSEKQKIPESPPVEVGPNIVESYALF